MKKYIVVRVVDPDTIEVSPSLEIDNEQHSIIGFRNYYGPDITDPHYFEARNKLVRVVEHKPIYLKNPEIVSHYRVNCDIYMGDKDIARELVTIK